MPSLKLYVHERDFIGDLYTPVSLYLKLQDKKAFLLESVTGGEHVARYSFIGLDPFAEFKEENSQITVSGDAFGKLDLASLTLPKNPVDALRDLMAQFQLEAENNTDPFLGGAVGYFAWETITHIESITLKSKPKSPYPTCHFIFPRSLAIFDHATRKVRLITISPDPSGNDANRILDTLYKRLQEPLNHKPLEINPIDGDPFRAVTSNYAQEKFKSDVEQVKSHIYEGNIYQMVLSQKFSIQSDKAPFDVYRKLRAVNPSPYMFYVDFADYQIVGSSPEILVKLDDRTAAVRPIAGTRPRISGQEEHDIQDLKTDEKELAEHLMLLDLGRNDLGRVCNYNTVKATDMFDIETYSHVIHMVSHVSGQLSKGKDAFDLFKATFPAGTLSGAPKIKAIEYIEDMEPEQRGPYGGALGYIDFRGNMDLCIVIRTLLHRDQQYTIQAGAGIVADSVPQTEYEEAQNKARAMITACLS